MKRIVLFIFSLLCITFANAQIGYQVSLLNTATGEPRANERVTAKIELSNSDGAIVYSETQTGATNDFGVLSLTIGNAQSLSSIDWSNYPMFISVTVDGVLIGKTQVMSVPYANAVVPLSNNILMGAWHGSYTVNIYESRQDSDGNYHEYVVPKTMSYSCTFHQNGTYSLSKPNSSENGTYFINGNTIICKYTEEPDPRIRIFYYENMRLHADLVPTLSK